MTKSNFENLQPSQILNAIDALQAFSTDGRCSALNSIENRVYEIGLDSGDRIVAKFYRPERWNLSTLQEEHDFLKELADNELPVLVPWRDPNGNSLFAFQNLYFAIWPLQKGRMIDEFSQIEFENLGRLLGRMHSIGRTKSFQNRTQLTDKDFAIPALRFLVDRHWIPNPNLESDYSKTALKIISHYQNLIETLDISLQRIHGDCHKGNLLRTSEEGLAILDFDDCMTGPVVQDFWMLLPFGDNQAESEREVFFDSYSQFADWNPRELSIIEPLRGIRYISYSAWIAKRWSDPSFPNLFPHFGTEEYWLKESQDLQQVLRNIVKMEQDEVYLSEALLREKEQIQSEETLTNKDFFWDM